ncbi:MAG: gas vesicle protein K [Candidatus Omnitrophica bacterium]|nr:gas vesicle protein K [Candidatus Omnitrophota bacterium]
MTEIAVQIPQGVQRRATLLDLLDRVLGKGVVAYGDIVLSIADLDLVYLNLRAVLSSIGALESKNGGSRFVDGGSKIPVVSDGVPELAVEGERRQTRRFLEEVETLREAASQLLPADDTLTDRPLLGGTSALPESRKAGKLELNPQKTAQGLAKLAMTLIHLLRKLMERQAIRRMEAGTLNPEQLERAGQAFQQLDDQIKELCKQFDLKEEDLNLDLGPLGKVV